MISLSGVTKTFDDLVAVDELDLTIPRGEIFTFIGPNGAGKTTTIKLIVGLLKPDSGRITVGGHDVQEEYLEAKSLISYVPDQPYLYDKLTGREFLHFVGAMYDIPQPVRQERIERLAERFEFESYADELGESYSHGMKQRIVISAALLHDPAALIIDEPTVGLDPKSANTLKKALRERAADGTAVFVSTHTLPLAEEIADRVGIIQHGRLTALGDLDEIYRRAEINEHLEAAFLRLTEEPTQSGPRG